ncbi:MAG: tetratricopeptide repeat protein, partial [Bacteroidales bacterium]|nr:tetratricopeptide repeat protein [Bacteroidales bacterium]
MLIKKILIIVFLFSLVLNPENKDKRERAYFYFYKGKVARESNNLNSAINNYIRAIKYEPSNTNYVMALVQVYFETGKFEKAQKILETNHSSFKNETEVFLLHFIQGIAYACNGEH